MAGIDFAVYVTPELAANMEREVTVEPKVIHRAATRGHINEGWLQARHTFSFTSYHNPERISFGKLRVFNEETVAPGAAFPMYDVGNMEIVYILLEGAIQHHDALGNTSVIRAGEILTVSAGAGLRHGYYNANRDHVARYIQLWIYPGHKNTEPHCGKYKTDPALMRNDLVEIVSPRKGAGAWINQQAWINMGHFDRGYEFRYRVHSKSNGAYVFLNKGEATVNGEKLRAHDAIGIWNTRCIDIRADTMTQVMVTEVPMY